MSSNLIGKDFLKRKNLYESLDELEKFLKGVISVGYESRG